jgi:hypothetical protein
LRTAVTVAFLLADQHGQPLAAGEAAPLLLAASFNSVSFQGPAEMDRETGPDRLG